MSNRRRSGRKAGSSSKKETPEKSSRRSTRRRGHKKSDSEPEGDDSTSERSFEDQDKSQVDVDPLALNRKDASSNEQKEDESGGSDGAWQVRSENGNKGGIPKLKLCLQRPADMSSPTSDTLPSPRTRRSRRGATDSPSKPDNSEESALDEANTSAEGDMERRSTRSRRQTGKKEEEVVKVQDDEPEPQQVEDTSAAEEDEKRKKALEEQKQREEEEKKQLAEETAKKALEEQKKMQELEARRKEEAENESRRKREAEAEVEKKRIQEEKEIALKEKAQKEEERKKSEAEKRAKDEKERIQREEERKKSEAEKRAKEEERRKSEAEKRAKEEERRKSEAEKRAKEEKERAQKEEERKKSEAEKRAKLEKERALKEEERKKLEAEKRAKEEEARNKRSPSRDSSEERAKEAALLSRKAKVEIKADQEATPLPSRNGPRIRTANLDDTAKDGANVVRKRRWGSSASNSDNKPTAISTDILKEIIPEAKPIPLSEVKLSPNREEELKIESEEELVVRPPAKRRHSMPSDESEKDYEEEDMESGGEEMVRKRTPIDTNHVDEPPKKTITNDVRKVVVAEASLDDLKQRSPSPAKNPPSNILYITNLVRPFTVVQLRDLLARTGNIVQEKGFWIDGIKSRCYVKYTTEDEAKTTRHALHGIQWPASNPKQLTVDFGTEQAMSAAIEGQRTQSPPPAPKRVVTDERRDRERVRNEDDRKRGIRHQDDDKPTRTVRKVTVPVREWDVGKTEGGISPPGNDAKQFDDDRRRRDRDRRRSTSGEPSRKIKRKEEPAPQKVLLDDLFRKTKATPCIYWLPLTLTQKALKEEMRRKHMEEHEKQLAEHRKRREANANKPPLSQQARSRSPKK